MNYSLGNMLGGAGALNPDKLALNLQFATDKTLTARRGPTPVFTRASGATQVGASGLIEFAPENTIQRSEEFDNATYWSPTRATITANATTSPTGTLTADKLVTDSTATNNHRIDRSTLNLSLSTVYTLSIYVKASEYSGFAIGVDPSSPVLGVQFSLSGSGSITAQLAGYTGAIQDAGNGWFRCSATFTSSASLATHRVYMYLGQNGTTFTYTGDGTSGIFIWGAQIERYASARTYIPTTNADVFNARFDHDPITLACKGLLIEESRTNLCPQSGNVGAWTGTFTNSGSTTAPDGTSAGYLAGIGTGNCQTLVTASVTGLHTLSVYLKRNNTDWARLQCVQGANVNSVNFWVNLATGAVGTLGIAVGTPTSLSAQVTPAGNGWYRCSVTASYPATNYLYLSVLSATADNNTTRVAGSIYGVWGAQIEAGAFPTSYIPTTTASVVRSADICSITGANFTSIYNQSEGTLFVDARVETAARSSNGFFAGIYNVSNNEFSTRIFTGNIQVVSRDPTSKDITIGSASTNTKAATAYSNLNNAGSLNGLTVVTGTASTLPLMTSLGIGSRYSNTLFLNGHIAAVRFYKKRLPNAKLQTLTA